MESIIPLLEDQDSLPINKKHEKISLTVVEFGIKFYIHGSVLLIPGDH